MGKRKQRGSEARMEVLQKRLKKIRAEMELFHGIPADAEMMQHDATPESQEHPGEPGIAMHKVNEIGR